LRSRTARWAVLCAALAALWLACAAPAAEAAPPTLGPVSATDIQGVSALLKGPVDPQGLSTAYYFEYSTAANFSGSVKTTPATAGSGSVDYPARAAISGLKPDTTYHYRLVATNSSGSAQTDGSATFTTTHGFGFLSGTGGFAANAYASGGGAATQADSHPYQLDLALNFNQGGPFEDQPGDVFADGDLRDLRLEMPAGLIANPSVLDKCAIDQFHTHRVSPFEASESGESCPDRSQVGTLEMKTSLGGGQTRRFGLYNLDPAPGRPAQLGAAPFGSPLVFDVGLRPNPDGSYVLTLDATNVPQALDLYGLKLSLWGTPWAASHDSERGNCLNETEPDFGWCKASIGEPNVYPPAAYLTLPPACSGPLAFSADADSWQQPTEVSANAINRTSGGAQANMTCGGLFFSPQPLGQLNDTKASSPSGYNFRLNVDESHLTVPEQLVPPPVKTATVRLPAGVTVNPSVGAGLGVCTPAQYAKETADSDQGDGCPNASKIGDFTVTTPLFSGILDGAIYLAQPDDPATSAHGAENPFDTLVAVYLVARLPDRGVIVKLAGRIVPDPVTGNLTATFDGLPELPYTDLDLTFRAGQRAFLVTPAACGAATSSIDMTPWAPAINSITNTLSSSQITTGINGGPCPSGTPPFAPGVIAGGVNSNVNSYTPYFVHLSRQDTEQEITGYSLVLPEGITGKLAGIPFCSDAAIEAARSKRGAAEAANPSCPESSLIGHVLTGYGVSSALTYTTGKIYLAGPYHGQPLSIVTINPATVGPFDLGTVVIRSAFSVNEHTAQLQIDKSASDAIPHIIAGIPLHLRDVRIYMDRPQFTHNPSSCAASQLVSTLTGSGASFATTADDSTSTATDFFQLLNCRTLGFQPKLGVRLRGGTKRNGHPELTATFQSRGQGDTNLKEISVTIPRQEFLAQDHIRGICTRAQFDSQTCPANSIYGHAEADTPLFDNPLTGNVYLRSHPGRKLPDLVADLYSGAVRIVVEGNIGPARGGIRALFKGLPDEPVDRFTMTLFGGKRGLLVNSANICAFPPTSDVEAEGQTNLGYIFTTKLRGQCGKGRHKKAHHRRHRRHHRGGRR
jgi:hypothetical protein